MAVRSGTKEELFSQPKVKPQEPWFDYGVDAPPKWQIITLLILEFGGIFLGYLYWGWGGAFTGYVVGRSTSMLVWRPYHLHNAKAAEEE